VARFLLAQPTSDNAGAGALLSLWLPLGLFIIVAAVLWVIYARPHHRVPPRPAAHAASSVAGSSAEPIADDQTGQQQEVKPPQPGSDETGPQPR